jgi:hypothetical protein
MRRRMVTFNIPPLTTFQDLQKPFFRACFGSFRKDCTHLLHQLPKSEAIPARRSFEMRPPEIRENYAFWRCQYRY